MTTPSEESARVALFPFVLVGIGAGLHLVGTGCLLGLAGARRGLVVGQPLGRRIRRAESFRLFGDPGQEPASVFHRQRAETGYAAGRIEVPRILRQTDEVADRGIGRPGTAQRRTRQIRGYALSQERSDIGPGAECFDRGLILRIGERLAFPRGSTGRRDLPGRFILRILRRRLGAWVRRRGVFAASPSREKAFVSAHRRFLCRGSCRASASGSARSRVRFSNTRSTWCSATNAAIV